jgi:hypothetical protein
VTCATNVQDTGELLVALQSPPDTMVVTLKLPGADAVGGGVDAGGGVGLVGVEGPSSLPEQPAANIKTRATPHHAGMRRATADDFTRVLTIATVAAVAKRIPHSTFTDCDGTADRCRDDGPRSDSDIWDRRTNL